MTAFKLIDHSLYADNGDGSYSGVKWCDLQSVTLECKCDEIDKKALEQLLFGENHYKEKPKNVKENNTMAQYTYGKFEVIKSQEDIELEEKIAKLRAEYDKKVAKLREEYKVAKEKKERDAKAKELHDKYQSLIDAGFSTDQAYDILQTKMKMDEF